MSPQHERKPRVNYQQQVKAAAIALVKGEQANWKLAQLTAEATYDRGANQHTQSDRVTMAQWCKDVREASGRAFSERTGQNYKAVWVSIRTGRTDPLPSWSETYDKVRGETKDEMHERIVAKQTIALPPSVFCKYCYKTVKLKEDPCEDLLRCARCSAGLAPYSEVIKAGSYAAWQQKIVPVRTEKASPQISPRIRLEQVVDETINKHPLNNGNIPLQDSEEFAQEMAASPIMQRMKSEETSLSLADVINGFCSKATKILDQLADRGFNPTHSIIWAFDPLIVEELDAVVTRIKGMYYAQSAEDLLRSVKE
jgi:hypothetical protein